MGIEEEDLILVVGLADGFPEGKQLKTIAGRGVKNNETLLVYHEDPSFSSPLEFELPSGLLISGEDSLGGALIPQSLLALPYEHWGNQKFVEGDHTLMVLLAGRVEEEGLTPNPTVQAFDEEIVKANTKLGLVKIQGQRDRLEEESWFSASTGLVSSPKGDPKARYTNSALLLRRDTVQAQAIMDRWKEALNAWVQRAIENHDRMFPEDPVKSVPKTGLLTKLKLAKNRNKTKKKKELRSWPTKYLNW